MIRLMSERLGNGRSLDKGRVSGVLPVVSEQDLQKQNFPSLPTGAHVVQGSNGNGQNPFQKSGGFPCHVFLPVRFTELRAANATNPGDSWQGGANGRCCGNGRVLQLADSRRTGVHRFAGPREKAGEQRIPIAAESHLPDFPGMTQTERTCTISCVFAMTPFWQCDPWRL
jgi:hypothetical protein